MTVWNLVWRSAYHDSVTLMRVTRDMEAVAGVERAAAMMATPHNRELLAGAGLLAEAGALAAPADLIVAVVAADEAAARGAEAAARRALSAVPAAGHAAASSGPRPRSLAAALRARPDASLALISVPGPYAAAEARKALRAGLHVMLFSDNVPVEAEVALKRLAAERGLFLLGPDCGTAIIAGVPLGFANAVPRGRIGVVAASGTGLQEITCLVARAGEGISHAIGVGGRDLTDAVGGLMTERALAALAEDPATEVICLAGKPPGPATAARLRDVVARLGKPCVLHFVGAVADGERPTGEQGARAARQDDRLAQPPTAGAGLAAGRDRDPGEHGPIVEAGTLEDCARAAVALARGEPPVAVEFTVPDAAVRRLIDDAVKGLTSGQRYVRGVYSGGTLAWEALHLLARALGDGAEDVTGGGTGHRVVDLGEDIFTIGRPHPMIDGSLRRDWIRREAADPATAVLLLDVVLGHGAHPDPAGELLPAIEAARAAARAGGRGLSIVATVVGTDGDLQDFRAQTARLEAAGAIVMPSNAQAARLAARIAARTAGGV